MRACRRCREEKPIDAFRQMTGKPYRHRTCYACELKQQAEYQQRPEVKARREAEKRVWDRRRLQARTGVSEEAAIASLGGAS